MYAEIVVTVAGGLGLFLFGIRLMAEGLQKFAGDKLRRALEFLTRRPVFGVLTGFAVTSIIQSSSSTTVMVVGFVNAGLMTLEEAISIILGANIGTTMTTQIVSLELTEFSLPAIAIGFALYFFSSHGKTKYFGQAILGFGLLFLGMTTMKNGVHPLREYQPFLDLLTNVGHQPIIGVIVAALFTEIIQSSSATTGIVVALSLEGLLTIDSALPLILGANIGTCITALLASIGTNLSARRAAVAHIMFNILGSIFWLMLLGPFTELVVRTAASVPRQIANAHTIFNVTNTLIVLPFIKQFTGVVERVIPGKEEILERGPKYLDRLMLKAPAMAISGAGKEVHRMATLTLEMLSLTPKAIIDGDQRAIKHVLNLEEVVDELEREIVTYLAVLSQQSLTEEQSRRVSGLMHAANDIERIGDHCQNMINLAKIKMDDRLPFSKEAEREVMEMHADVYEMYEDVLVAFDEEDEELARNVWARDNKVDRREKMLRRHHIERINRGKCFPASGVVYLDILSNLERIGDHATNIAQVVLGEI